MSKTPFEIRLDLLAMAQSVLSDNIYQERNRLEQDWQLQRDQVVIKLHAGSDDVEAMPAFPKLPTISEEEIIRLAKKLNDFVSNTNNE